MKGYFRQRLLFPLVLPVAAFAFVAAAAFGFSRILLASTKTGALIIALMVAVGILGTAALVAALPRIRGVQLASMLGVVVGVALLAGGVVSATVTEEEEEEGEGPGGPGGPPVVSIAAPQGAATSGFDPTSLSAPAGIGFVMRFENQDPGVPHNVTLFGGEDETGEQVFTTGAPANGPIVQEGPVPPLDQGDYFFRCDVHPTTMTGTLTVEEGPPGGEGGGPGGGPTLVAQDLAFDKTELLLPSEREVTVRLDNRDAGVPHNFALYTEQGGEAIFQGETFSGPDTREYVFEAPPPGEYYFQCDVHPTTMTGTVRVE